MFVVFNIIFRGNNIYNINICLDIFVYMDIELWIMYRLFFLGY